MRSQNSRLSIVLGIFLFLILKQCSPGIHESAMFLTEEQVITSRLPAQPELIWKHRLSTPVKDIFAVNDQRLLLNTFRGELYFLALQSGKRSGKIWKPYRRPADLLFTDQANNQIYMIANRDNHFIHYNLKSSQIESKFKINNLHGNAVIHHDTVTALQSDRRIIQFKLKNKTVIRELQMPEQITWGIFEYRDQYLLYTADGMLRFFDRNLLPVGTLQLPLSIAPELLIVGNSCYGVDSRGKFLVIDLINRDIQLEKNFAAPIFISPLIRDGKAILGCSDGSVFRIDLTSGEEIWNYSGSGLINRPLTAIGQSILVPYAQGEIVALQHDSGEKLWEISIENGINLCQPVPLGLIVLDRRHNIYYYGIK
jgi:outer membrane protein assembly factor BamB